MTFDTHELNRELRPPRPNGDRCMKATPGTFTAADIEYAEAWMLNRGKRPAVNDETGEHWFCGDLGNDLYFEVPLILSYVFCGQRFKTRQDAVEKLAWVLARAREAVVVQAEDEGGAS